MRKPRKMFGPTKRRLITAKVDDRTREIMDRQMKVLGLSRSKVLDMWGDWAREREQEAEEERLEKQDQID